MDDPLAKRKSGAVRGDLTHFVGGEGFIDDGADLVVVAEMGNVRREFVDAVIQELGGNTGDLIYERFCVGSGAVWDNWIENGVLLDIRMDGRMIDCRAEGKEAFETFSCSRLISGIAEGDQHEGRLEGGRQRADGKVATTICFQGLPKFVKFRRKSRDFVGGKHDETAITVPLMWMNAKHEFGNDAEIRSTA